MVLLSMLKDKDMYAYQLTKELARKSEQLFTLQVGLIYPTLYSLQEKGYISEIYKTHHNRTQIYYHIETTGIDYFNNIKSEYLLLNEGIMKVINIPM